MNFVAAFESAVVQALGADSMVLASVNYCGLRTDRLPSAPYIVIEPMEASDWGTKDRVGAEIRLALQLAVPGAEVSALHDLVAAVERVLALLPGVFDGWQLVTLVPVRKRLSARTGGAGGIGPQWRAVLEYRARVIAG